MNKLRKAYWALSMALILFSVTGFSLLNACMLAPASYHPGYLLQAEAPDSLPDLPGSAQSNAMPEEEEEEEQEDSEKISEAIRQICELMLLGARIQHVSQPGLSLLQAGHGTDHTPPPEFCQA